MRLRRSSLHNFLMVNHLAPNVGILIKTISCLDNKFENCKKILVRLRKSISKAYEIPNWSGSVLIMGHKSIFGRTKQTEIVLKRNKICSLWRYRRLEWMIIANAFNLNAVCMKNNGRIITVIFEYSSQNWLHLKNLIYE